MIIPVRIIDTFVEQRDISVVVDGTNVSLLSRTVIRDPNLMNDLKSFATKYNINLYRHTRPTIFFAFCFVIKYFVTSKGLLLHVLKEQ